MKESIPTYCMTILYLYVWKYQILIISDDTNSRKWEASTQLVTTIVVSVAAFEYKEPRLELYSRSEDIWQNYRWTLEKILHQEVEAQFNRDTYRWKQMLIV